MTRLARIALWCLVIYVVVVGLQACGTKKAYKARYDLDLRHER